MRWSAMTVCLLFNWNWFLHAQPEPVVIRYPIVLHEEATLRNHLVHLLETALKASEQQFGPFVLEGSKVNMEQIHILEAMAKGERFDVRWTMTNQERENLLRPIRIPLLKGLMGCRVFLVRQDRIGEFSDITNFDALLHFKAGQAHDWTDTPILEANGIDVFKGRDSIAMIKALKADQYDYFPRGLTEAKNELRASRSADLALEPNLMLFYPAPFYFFVHRDNQALAQRLETGMRVLFESGQFDDIFLEFLQETGVLEDKPFTRRKIFRLKNPSLPAETPLTEERLWWSGTQALVGEQD
jgi:hypothetical protein